MGEYAEMMLDGYLCQSCGEYMDGGDGFPQSCGGCLKEERSNKDFLIIKKIEKLETLEMFLHKREFNFVHGDRTDKIGQPMIGLMFKEKGKKPIRKGLIVCKNKDLHFAALKIVNDAKIGENQNAK